MSVTRYTVGLKSGAFVCEINLHGGWVDYDEHAARCQEINDKWALENRALAAGLAQMQVKLDVALMACGEHKVRVAALEAALRGLYDDNVDYLRLNHLGGYDNHWLVAARKALGIAVETACESPKLMPCWCPYCGEPHSPAVRETKDG